MDKAYYFCFIGEGTKRGKWLGITLSNDNSDYLAQTFFFRWRTSGNEEAYSNLLVIGPELTAKGIFLQLFSRKLLEIQDRVHVIGD